MQASSLNGSFHLGNYTPVAVDRHNLTLWGINRESPNLTGYRFLEDLQQRQAGKMGIAPAQYQAAVWLPYAESGNVPRCNYSRTGSVIRQSKQA